MASDPIDPAPGAAGRPRRVGVNARSAPGIVGISSDTVGWMGMVCCKVVQGGLAFITSSTPWIASSPSTPRIAAPRTFSGSASTTIFMKPCVDLLNRPGNPCHRPPADLNCPPRAAGFSLGKADAAQRRIDVERLGADPVAHAARRSVEKVLRHDRLGWQNSAPKSSATAGRSRFG